MSQEPPWIVGWTPTGWTHYLYWQEHDQKMLARLNDLIRDALRHPFEGIGKPELLRNQMKGHWSRRISHEHRLVYRIEGNAEARVVLIIQCRFHY